MDLLRYFAECCLRTLRIISFLNAFLHKTVSDVCHSAFRALNEILEQDKVENPGLGKCCDTFASELLSEVREIKTTLNEHSQNVCEFLNKLSSQQTRSRLIDILNPVGRARAVTVKYKFTKRGRSQRTTPSLPATEKNDTENEETLGANSQTENFKPEKSIRHENEAVCKLRDADSNIDGHQPVTMELDNEGSDYTLKDIKNGDYDSTDTSDTSGDDGGYLRPRFLPPASAISYRKPDSNFRTKEETRNYKVPAEENISCIKETPISREEYCSETSRSGADLGNAPGVISGNVENTSKQTEILQTAKQTSTHLPDVDKTEESQPTPQKQTATLDTKTDDVIFAVKPSEKSLSEAEDQQDLPILIQSDSASHMFTKEEQDFFQQLAESLREIQSNFYKKIEDIKTKHDTESGASPSKRTGTCHDEFAEHAKHSSQSMPRNKEPLVFGVAENVHVRRVPKSKDLGDSMVVVSSEGDVLTAKSKECFENILTVNKYAEKCARYSQYSAEDFRGDTDMLLSEALPEQQDVSCSSANAKANKKKKKKGKKNEKQGKHVITGTKEATAETSVWENMDKNVVNEIVSYVRNKEVGCQNLRTDLDCPTYRCPPSFDSKMEKDGNP